MEEEYVVLSQRLKATKAYHAPRIEPEHLKAAVSEHRATVRYLNGQIEAFAALWPTRYSRKCCEIGTVFVGDALRGNGLCGKLVAETAEILAPQGASLFLITKDPAAMCAAENLGFRPVTTQSHPDVLEGAMKRDVVCRLPTSIHSIVAPNTWGTPKAGERWLFMRE